MEGKTGEKTESEERRKSKRYKVKTQVIIEGEPYDVTNISTTGCELIPKGRNFELNSIYESELVMSGVKLDIKLFFKHFNEKQRRYGAEFAFYVGHDRFIVERFVRRQRTGPA